MEPKCCFDKIEYYHVEGRYKTSKQYSTYIEKYNWNRFSLQLCKVIIETVITVNKIKSEENQTPIVVPWIRVKPVLFLLPYLQLNNYIFKCQALNNITPIWNSRTPSV